MPTREQMQERLEEGTLHAEIEVERLAKRVCSHGRASVSCVASA